MASYRRNNKINRRRIKTLERRRDFLEDRVGSDRSEMYDEAEYQALKWAIKALWAYIEEDPRWVFVDSEEGPHLRGRPDEEPVRGTWHEVGVAYPVATDAEGRNPVWLIYDDKDNLRAATYDEIAVAEEAEAVA